MRHFKYLFLALLLVGVTVWAQPTGTIVGLVTDEEGNAIPGASVTAKNVQTGLTQSTVTNERGFFRLERLPRGIYNVTAELEGFQTVTQEGIELASGAEVNLTFKLKIGKIEEAITVVATTPLVETTRAAVSNVITEKQVMDLPMLNRNFFQLVYISPGATPGAGRAGYSITGQRGSSNQVTIDGITNDDIGTAANDTLTLPPEAIQEFRLISNNFSAEYGRNTGGILNVSMKSGTNELHGSAWVFNRDNDLAAADWYTHEKEPLSRWQYGFTLGGPIVKDKTFFFVMFEGVNHDESSAPIGLFFTPQALDRIPAGTPQKWYFDKYRNNYVEQPGNKYPVPTHDFIDVDGDGIPDYGRAQFNSISKYSEYNVGIKIDHIFSEKDRISFRWIYDFGESHWNYNGGYNTLLPEMANNYFHYHTGGITWLHIFSPTMYNEVRLGFHRDYDDYPRTIAEVPLAYFYDGVVGIGDATNLPQVFTNNTFQLADTLSFQVGNHSIKAGFEARYWRSYSVFDAYKYGSYYWFYGLEFLYNYPAYRFTIGADPPPGIGGNDDYTSAVGSWSRGDTYRNFHGLEGGIFVQDDWRITPRLTLSMGLRWEYYGVPEERHGKMAMPSFAPGDYVTGIKYLIADGRQKEGKPMWDPYYLNFAPKLSVAYDLTGDGKTSLRAGAGVSYDRTFNNIYENDRFNFPDFCFSSFFLSYYYSIPTGLPRDNVRGSYSLRWMDPKLKPGMAYNWLLGIQREIATDLGLEVNYVGSIGMHLGWIHRLNRFTGDRLDGRRDYINPYFAATQVNFRAQDANSRYHGLQIILTKRYSKGLQFQTSYTFGKAIDMNSDYFGDAMTGSLCAVGHEVREMEYGRAAFDYRHNLVGSFIYELPFFKESENKLLKTLFGGWQINGIFQVLSGRPFTVFNTSADWNRDWNGYDRPLWGGGNFQDAIKDYSPFGGSKAPSLDKSKFPAPSYPKGPGDLDYYKQNLLGRNTFEWLWNYNLDLSLMKNFTIPLGGRDTTLQLRAEFINAFNHHIWQFPERNLASGVFGTTARKDGRRIVQLSIRYLF